MLDSEFDEFLDQLGQVDKLAIPLLKRYFDALTDEGFTRGEALVLVFGFQKQVHPEKKNE